MSNLLTLAGPVATIIAAGAAVFVTWRLGQGQLRIAEQQAQTAKLQAGLAEVRLQHDLFDRRFVIYQAARVFVVEEIVRNARVSDEALERYMRGTTDAVFLFDNALTEFLTEIRHRAIRLRLMNKLINEPSTPSEKRGEYVEEETVLITWFLDNQQVIVEKFKPFLLLGPSLTTSHPPPT